MSESSEDIQYQPYRPAHQRPNQLWDPTRRTSHANGQASGSTHDAAPAVSTARDEPLFLNLPPSPVVPDAIPPSGKQSLSQIALLSLGLGLALGVCGFAGSVLSLRGSELWRLPFFFVALAIFHFLEFFATARYNTAAVTIDSFLLTSNGSAYNVAHMLAALETTVMHSIWSYPKIVPAQWQPSVLALGLALLIVGQSARSTAMAHAGTNFNHIVQSKKRTGHELVTTGIYAILRHPSYFGFFWWALGTQIVLGNVVCFSAYLVVLWRFFSRRIRGMC